MWNDWLSSLNGPSNEQSHIDPPEPIETPKRFSNPQQIERLQSLQAQHQQLQVEQLHLLHRQTELMKRLGMSPDMGTTDTASTAPQSPSSAISASLADTSRPTPEPAKVLKKQKQDIHVKTEDSDIIDDDGADAEQADGSGSANPSSEAWQQFHALQAQQWAQALSQARTAKRGSITPSGGTGGLLTNGSSSASMGASGVGLLGSGGSGSLSGVAGGKRCKAYAAPKGVWKNNGGYNATIYVHKRRIYGPIRRDLSDAIEDRKEMEEALRELTAIHSSPEDAAILEVEMREVVAGLRNRSTPASSRLDGSLPTSRVLDMSTPPMGGILSDPLGGSVSGSRKKLRIIGNGASAVANTTSTGTPDELLDDLVEDGSIFGGLMGAHQGQVIKADPSGGNNGFNPLVDMMTKDEYDGPGVGSGFTPQTGPLLFSTGASPMMLPGHHNMSMLNDDGMDMLPDPLGGSGAGLWGCH